MSLGIAFKGAEGIVLAADSRVTLLAMLKTAPPAPGQGPAPTPQAPGPGPQAPVPQGMALPATYDNATKLLTVAGQEFVGAVTYGRGALGQAQPRTAHSFIPEFEAELAKKSSGKNARLSVQKFAEELSDFFMRQWQAQGMPTAAQTPPGEEMVFLVGGYDEDAPYGRIFEIYIPTKPQPVERQVNEFGMLWGGQREYTDRLIAGFDPNLPALVQQSLQLTNPQLAGLMQQLRGLQAPIPFQFLPLQDCVNLSILLIRTTIQMQTFLVGVRGVGGAIDIATITRTEGLRPIQLKKVVGEFDYSLGGGIR